MKRSDMIISVLVGIVLGLLIGFIIISLSYPNRSIQVQTNEGKYNEDTCPSLPGQCDIEGCSNYGISKDI